MALFAQHIYREGYTAATHLVEAALLAEADRLNNRGFPQALLGWQVHLRDCTDRAKARGDETAAALCNTFAFHLDMVGELGAAKPYYEKALAIFVDRLGASQSIYRNCA